MTTFLQPSSVVSSLLGSYCQARKWSYTPCEALLLLAAGMNSQDKHLQLPSAEGEAVVFRSTLATETRSNQSQTCLT
jgi:hypothetical protein